MKMINSYEQNSDELITENRFPPSRYNISDLIDPVKVRGDEKNLKLLFKT